MTEKILIRQWIKRGMRERNANYIFPNVFINGFECDVIEITPAGYAYEYEVKLTVADFRKDIEKHYTKHPKEKVFKHDQMKNGHHLNYFYYVVPEDLIQPADVPQHAGLIYLQGKYFRVIKPAPKLSKEKKGIEIKDQCFLSSYYKYLRLF
jgi:hypothetical protein